MTAHGLITAFRASDENSSRLAFRTAHFSKLKVSVFQKGEDAFFTVKPKRQSLREQFQMAKLITRVMH